MPSNAVIALKPDLQSEALIDLATEVLSPGATIHLVSLVQVNPQQDELDLVAKTEAGVEAVAGRLAGLGYSVETRVHVAALGIGAEVASIASEIGADLIVIGLTKRSRVGKALLGSDAQTVLMSAECPVLATRLA